MKNIALYVRVSTEEAAGKPEGSLKSQEQRLRDYVNRRNETESWGEIKAVYIERGKSAKDTNRPELQKLLSGIENHLFDLVMVTEISRLSRSTKDFCDMLDLFKKQNCKILSLREQFDTTSAAGEMMMHMLMNFAQFERQQTAERISANFRARAKRGLHNGGMTSIGYMFHESESGKLVIEPQEAEVVRECFKTFLSEGSLSSAVKSLNKRGVSTKRVKGKSGPIKATLNYFSTDRLYGILKNPVYIAKKPYLEDGVEKLANAQWQAIIDEDTFNKIGEILKKNHCHYKPDHWKKHPYILSGLVFCDECKSSLVGKTAHGKTRRHFYYDHGSVLKKNFFTNNPGCPCKKKRVKAPLLESAIVNRLKQMFVDESIVNGLIKEAKSSHYTDEIKNKVKLQKNKIQKTKTSIETILSHLESIPTGTKAQSLYQRLSHLEEQRGAFEEDLNRLNTDLLSKVEVIEPQQYLEFLNTLVLQLEKAPHELQKQLIRSAIHKIIVHPNQIEVLMHVGKYVLDSVPAEAGVKPGNDNKQGKDNKKNLIRCSHTLTYGGPDWDRTSYLFNAIEALSQMSYRPRNFICVPRNIY